MANCTNCYETNTALPCESVGCLSTNYGKCITYSGSNLFCQSGAIATFGFTGTAVAPSVDTTVVASATGGNGISATFTVTRKAGSTTYEVTLDNGGSAYEVSDVLTISGGLLGGTSPTNDIVITVSTLAAVISNGANLDSIIQNFNNRLCLVAASSPSGLDYTAFNYGCLRVGGNLESVGTPITSAEGFVEAVSAALCSVNVRVKALETPAITVPSCLTGVLTSGTSTLVNILDSYGSKICTHDTNLTMTGVQNNPCIGYAFTSKPTSNNIYEYINWITSNMCGIHSTLSDALTNTNIVVTDIREYITGSPSAPLPTSVNTSCLSGGSATSSLKDAVDLIVSELCSTITAIGGLGSSNYTVDWSCFSGTYASNSVFGAQGLGAFTSTTTLQTHLNQIASALSDLNIKFDSTYFTVNNTSCGPLVSFTGASAFACSALASCTLNSMGDVTYIGSPITSQILARNSAGQWVNNNLRVIVNHSAGVDTYFGVQNTPNGSLDVTINLPSTNVTALVPSPTISSWTVGIGPTPHISDWPEIQNIYTSGIVQPYRYAGVVLTNSSGGNLTITDNSAVNLLNTPNAANLCFVTPMYFPVSVVEKTSAGGLNAIHNCLIKVHSTATTTVTGGTYSLIDLVNVKGGSIVVANGNYLEIYFGGFSWSNE